MTRKLVFETQCSRCERTETQEVPKGAAEDPDEGETFYAILVDGQTFEVRFNDLCTPCKRTIRALLEQIGKPIKGVSPDRKTERTPKEAKKKVEGQAAALVGQPPAPHAPAGTLKPPAVAPTPSPGARAEAHAPAPNGR